MSAAPVVLTAEMALELRDNWHKTGPIDDALTSIIESDVVCRVADEWRPMSEVPDCDDELWFCRGDTFEGPRPPRWDDIDYWDWWCYARPPHPPAPPKEQDNG